MKQIIFIFALILSTGVSNFAKVAEPIKTDWLQMWTADGHVTLHDDGDRCHVTSIIEYADGSFDYTVTGVCGQTNPLYGVNFYYGVQ